MKKFVMTLMACLATVQSIHAATSALTESLLEYEAITSAIGTDPNFQNVITPIEFIVDIKRLTRAIDVTGSVKYEILTQIPNSDGSSSNSVHSHSHHHNHPRRTTTYIAILDVAPNPGIGPNIITVVSISKSHSQLFRYFDQENLLEIESTN